MERADCRPLTTGLLEFRFGAFFLESNLVVARWKLEGRV